MPSITMPRRRAVRTTAVALVALLIGAGVTYAAIPATTTGRISACYATSGTKAGLLRIIDEQAGGKCLTTERKVTWQANGVRYMRNWGATVVYYAGDVVTVAGASYIAVTPTKGNAPATSPTKWAVFAAKGATGATGVAGAAGAPGAPGATGATGPQFGRPIVQVGPALASSVQASPMAMTTLPNGNPIAAYVTTLSGIAVVACLDPTCLTATSPAVVLPGIGSGSGRILQTPSIAMGPEGRAIISATDTNNSQLIVASCVDLLCTSVSTPKVIVSTGFFDRSQVTFDETGRPLVAFPGVGGGFLAAGCATVDCSGPSDPSVGIAFEQTAAISGFATVAFGRPASGPLAATLRNGAVHLSICGDSTCFNPPLDVVVSPPASAPMFPQLVVGPGFRPVVEYWDSTTGELRLAICTDATCTAHDTRVLAVLGSPGPTQVALTLAPDGSPIAGYTASGTAHAVLCGGQTCPSFTNVVLGSGVGGTIDVALNSFGNPVFMIGTDAGGLEAAYLTHSSWSKDGWGR